MTSERTWNGFIWWSLLDFEGHMDWLVFIVHKQISINIFISFVWSRGVKIGTKIILYNKILCLDTITHFFYLNEKGATKWWGIIFLKNSIFFCFCLYIAVIIPPVWESFKPGVGKVIINVTMYYSFHQNTMPWVGT